MLPKKEFNIYPKSEENLKSLVSFYFDKYDLQEDNGLDILKGMGSLTLNQIEFMCRKLSESYIPVFQKHFKTPTTLSNLIKYGLEALTDTQTNGSKPRQQISQEFQEFVKSTEVDFLYLEKNN